MQHLHIEPYLSLVTDNPGTFLTVLFSSMVITYHYEYAVKSENRTRWKVLWYYSASDYCILVTIYGVIHMMNLSNCSWFLSSNTRKHSIT